jgi:hypothetical protein
MVVLPKSGKSHGKERLDNQGKVIHGQKRMLCTALRGGSFESIGCLPVILETSGRSTQVKEYRGLDGKLDT